jgi:hypothetical protein
MMMLEDTIKYIPKQSNDHYFNDIVVMLKVIFEMGFQDNIRNFNDEDGFMFSNNDFVYKIGNNEKVLESGHSGASFAICLRNCQYALKKCHEENEKIYAGSARNYQSALSLN